jgi:asparagine synthase (glutamine-hydrolysing)
VACLGGDASALDRAAAGLRWHRGRPRRHHWQGLEIVALEDDVEGPWVEVGAGRLRLTHGAGPAPLAQLQRTGSRFVALDWDGRQLQVARDPMGLAPVFYRVLGDALWLATEVAALLALDRPAPDLEALAARTAFVPLDDRTGWQGVFRVLPGSTLAVDRRLRPASTVYWDPVPLLGRHPGGPAAVQDEFRQRFRTAVARCWGPASAILLSGGLDSAALALTVRALNGAAPHLVHVHYPDLPATHEQPYADAVAGAVGQPLHVVRGDLRPWDVAGELQGWSLPYNWLPYGMDEPPLVDAAGRGLTRVLDGHDGDGILGPAGSEWGQLILGGHWGHVARLARRQGPGPALLGAAVDLLPPYPWLRRLAGKGPKVTGLQAVARYFQEPLRSRIIEADIDQWRWPPRRWRVRQLQPVLPRATISFEQKELEAARHGIDMRHPFADRELVEFLISLPARTKTEPGRPKALLLDAFGDELPRMLHARPKSDYMAAVRRRVDVARCLDEIRATRVRLPGVDYEQLFADARAEPSRMPLFLLVNLTRVHEFARSAA